MQKNDEMILCGKKYFIVANIGQGSFGSVLKVLDEQKNEYALKVMSQQDQNEENIMKKLNAVKPHRNIVNFIKSGKIEQPNLSKEENKLEYFYILMEYCDTDLYKQLQQKLVPQSDLRYIIVSIADGLSHLHLNNIIHRDLKPENVFVKILKFNGNQTQNIYKLGDFGCSTEKSIAESQHVGTPYYMAPEIIKGETYDSKVDIWALGTIAYELLTGQPLFNGPNVEFIFQLIEQQTDDSPYIKEKLKMLNDEYKPIVFKMLKVTPSLRPDINEVIRTLRNNGYKSPTRIYQPPLPSYKSTISLKQSADKSGYEANKQQIEKNIQTIQKFIPKMNVNNLQQQNLAEGPKSSRVAPSNQLQGQQKIQPIKNFPAQIQIEQCKPLQQNQNQEIQTMQDNKPKQNIQISSFNQQQAINNHEQNLQPFQKSQDSKFQQDSQIKKERNRFHSPQNQFSSKTRTEPIEEGYFNEQQQMQNNNSQIKNTNQTLQINKPNFNIQINNVNHQAVQFHSPQGQQNQQKFFFQPNKK